MEVFFMDRQTIQWTVSLPPSLSKKALKIAKEEFRTRSELVREALRRYLENRIVDRARAKLSRRFKALGITTEEGIERLIDEGRR
jgi:metal-responsive CopG/Arc/MetJ family transcriptional regulator